MVAAVNALDSQLFVRSVDMPTPDARVTQLFVRTVYNYPAEQGLVSQFFVRAADMPTPDARVSQFFVRALIKGHTANPRIRAWTFTLDGHDFYVLRLGDSLTLVYDDYSEQWMDWQNASYTHWSLNIGTVWNGAAALAQNFGSSVVVGDDTYGLLWFLDPNQPYDQHPDTAQPVYFERITMGQVPMRGREVLPCYAAWLTTDMGDPAYTGAAVQLEISDDGGVTFDDMGSVEITTGAAYPELSWESLGQIGAPGRLFKITDDGAITRIDGMEMNDPDDA